jgi:ribosomal protein S12 methylthiotransferase
VANSILRAAKQGKPFDGVKAMSMQQTENTVYINTLGCPKNEVDGEILAAHLIGAGWSIVDKPELATAEIVNTCGFISQAKSESIEAIFEAVFRRKELGGQIIITGCLAQRYGKELCEQIPQADAIIGLQRPDLVVRVLTGREKPVNGHVCWIGSPESQGALDVEIRPAPHSIYGYIKIADGCDNRCTYCVIPTIRGSLRSRALDAIEHEARNFIEGGVREIILVGQDTAAYGTENGKHRLPAVLQRLNAIPGDFWIRVLYMHPVNLTDEIIDTFAACDKIVPYMDIPLQHISDSMLKIMARHVTRRDIEERLTRVRDTIKDVTIRTTFLIGHPGETEKDFNELVSFVEDFEFDRLGCFAYSPEEGTRAFHRTDAPSPSVTDARIEQLQETQEAIVARRSQRYLGTQIRTLLEAPSDIYEELWEGRTTGDAPEIDGSIFVTANGRNQPGFAEVIVEQADGYDLFGRML